MSRVCSLIEYCMVKRKSLCVEKDENDWQTNFLVKSGDGCDDNEDADEDDELDEEPMLKMKSFCKKKQGTR